MISSVYRYMPVLDWSPHCGFEGCYPHGVDLRAGAPTVDLRVVMCRAGAPLWI